MVIHELVDECIGDLINLSFWIRDFSDEDISTGIDTVLGNGSEHILFYKAKFSHGTSEVLARITAYRVYRLLASYKRDIRYTHEPTVCIQESESTTIDDLTEARIGEIALEYELEFAYLLSCFYLWMLGDQIFLPLSIESLITSLESSEESKSLGYHLSEP